jgi:chromosomal replication initiator protein
MESHDAGSVTFTSFVAADGSLEAVELAQALARSAPSAPRLLLLCGRPGSGKTHLLRAIGHFVSRERPPVPVIQTTAEEVLQRWVAAARRGEALETLGPPGAVVTIDDLHTLAGRVAVQREFARQLAAAIDHGTRLACAIGRFSEAPVLVKAIKGLPGARVVQLRPATGVAMSRILAELARGEATPLPRRQLQSIAARCRGDVRRACGAIARQRLLELRASEEGAGADRGGRKPSRAAEPPRLVRGFSATRSSAGSPRGDRSRRVTRSRTR